MMSRCRATWHRRQDKHSRFTMSITLRAYIFFGVVVLVGIVGQWSTGTDSDFWKILLVAFIAGLVVEKLVTRKMPMELHRQFPMHVYLGRPFKYDLEIRNSSHRPLSMEAVEGFPAQTTSVYEVMKLAVGGRQQVAQQLQAVPNRLGELSWDALHTRITGLLGLARWNRKLSEKQSIKVVPDHLRLSETRAASQNLGDLSKRRIGSGFELIGLRDYLPGDSLRSIDWKATARSGKHTVRVFTEEQRLELTLLVDVGRRSALQAGSLTRLGHYVNVAARLAEKTILEGNSVSLVCFSDKLLASSFDAKGRAGILRIRALLERLTSQATDSNLLPAVFEARKRTHQRNLVVLLTDLDETSVDSQLAKATSLLVPKHLPLVASILDDETVELESRYAHSWFDPYKTIAAHEALLESRRAALHLRQQGAHVVYARPDRLDKEVMNYYQYLLERNRV